MADDYLPDVYPLSGILPVRPQPATVRDEGRGRKRRRRGQGDKAKGDSEQESGPGRYMTKDVVTISVRAGPKSKVGHWPACQDKGVGGRSSTKDEVGKAKRPRVDIRV